MMGNSDFTKNKKIEWISCNPGAGRIPHGLLCRARCRNPTGTGFYAVTCLVWNRGRTFSE
jgi:hypothetical protein